MGNTRDTGYLQNLVTYDASGNIVLPANLTVNGNLLVATQSYVTTQISNLINGAPALLDTLDELAAALGDDASFASTITTSIAGKQAQLNGTGFVKVTGTTISYDNSTYLTTGSASSTYLPLIGGTLTGTLNGTIISLSNAYTDTINITSTVAGTTKGHIGQFSDSLYISNNYFYNGSQSFDDTSKANSSIEFAAGSLLLKTGAANTVPGTKLTITSTGAATFTSSVTALNAILSGTGSAFADGLRINRNSNTNQYTVINHLGGATNIVSVDQSGNNIAEIYFGRSINGSTISTSMTINASGNVGIGTTSPTTYSLSGTHTEIFGGSTYSFLHVNTTTVKSFLASNESALLTALFTFSAHPLTLGTSNTERLRITPEGYLGTTVTSTTISAGDLLGVLSFVSKDSSTYSSGGITNIRSYATSTYNTGNVAGDLRFYVSNGLQNITGTYLFGTEAMRINSDGVVRIINLASNGLVGTDSSGNIRTVLSEYTEIATGTITYSMNSGSPWAINNSFPSTIRDYNDDGMVGSGGVATNLNIGRGVTFDLGSAKAVRRIVERGYPTKNLNTIIVQYSTDNSNWTDIYVYNHIYGNTQKTMEFNPTGAISARYWRWFIHSWSEREVQNYYTYECIIYT